MNDMDAAARRAQMPIPLPLLLLDGVGALVFALGAAGHFGGVALLSRWLPQVPQVDVTAMIVGGALMAVAMVGIVRAALRRSRELRAASAPPPAQPGLASSQQPRR